MRGVVLNLLVHACVVDTGRKGTLDSEYCSKVHGLIGVA